MNSYEELFALAQRLDSAAHSPEFEAAEDALNKLDNAAREVGRAASGSWLGYQANVYYAELQVPPPGAQFSTEWGLKDMSFTSLGSRGDWREFDPQTVLAHIRRLSSEPDLTSVKEAARKVTERFSDAKAEIRSILLTEDPESSDTFLSQLLDDLGKLEPLHEAEILDIWHGRGQVISRDMNAIGQGTKVPPTNWSRRKSRRFDRPSISALKPPRPLGRQLHT